MELVDLCVLHNRASLLPVVRTMTDCSIWSAIIANPEADSAPRYGALFLCMRLANTLLDVLSHEWPPKTGRVLTERQKAPYK